MQKSNFLFILKSFLVWRVLVFIAAVVAVNYLPLFSDNFLAGRVQNYSKNPLFWGWANFDGEHYTSIAIYGYKNLQQAFFPAYPFLIKFFSLPFGVGLPQSIWTGLIVSNLSFLGALFIFWKVVRLDYSEKIAKLALISLLVFPTSFYFGAVYTESLFLLTSLLTYYLYRKDKYLLSGLVGILMTATRIYGVFVLMMILVDIMQRKLDLKKFVKEKVYLLGVSAFGLFTYMLFSWKNYADPLAFYNLQTIVGEQHQKGIILLPQVFFRYVKIIFLGKVHLYSLQTTLLEVTTAILFVILPIYAYIKKIRWSYVVYILFGFLVPSAQGSFSSVPRYLVVIFPAFIVMAVLLEKQSKLTKSIYFILSGLWLMINTSLFLRGYWIA
ncbi:hypothetical protein ISR94_01220 [Candidatus Microgenomates bacterium]|nr:hypothetical protein [Candidatus Microgenomates bacterium]